MAENITIKSAASYTTGLPSLLSLFLLVFSCSAYTATGIDKRIELAAEHIIRMQLDSGLFIYEHDFVSGADSRQNNIVRQAGAAFALGEYFLYSKNPAARKAIDRARSAFERHSVAWGEGKLLAWNGEQDQAKAGATALAILATLFSAADEQAVQSDGQLHGWVKGILALQQPNGGFSSKPGSEQQSAYSNGEIWLALAVLVKQSGDGVDPVLSGALEQADNRFLAFYTDQPDIGFFHWGMMAAANRFWSTRDPRFSRFIAEQTSVFLEKLRPDISRKSNSCYSVEGLLAGLEVLNAEQGYERLSGQVGLRVDEEMRKNRRLQILPGQKKIRFSKTRYLKAPELERYSGAFLNGKYRPQIRIDATQHCLSAMLKDKVRSAESAPAPIE